MSVRAKLKLREIRESKWSKEGQATKTLRFDAVYDSTIPEDQRFQVATPSGHIELQIDNPVAVAQFELWQDYYVDFSPVIPA